MVGLPIMFGVFYSMYLVISNVSRAIGIHFTKRL